MWNRLIRSPLLFVYIAAGVVVTSLIGLFAGNKILLPVLNTAVAYPVMFSLLKNEQRKRAFVSMIFWAAMLGLVMVWAVTQYPEQAEDSVLVGAKYRSEMFHWIMTGEGAEGDPVRFVPQHLLHLGIFCVLSVITASSLSLLMGSVLMNYMSFYVGSLILASSDKIQAALMGWHPWSIVRVISFVMLGVILGEPLIAKLTKRDYSYEEPRPYFWIALGGIGLDILVKALLAPTWGLILRRLIS